MKTVLVCCLVLFLSLSLVHSEKNSLDLNLLRGLLQGGEKDCTFKCFGVGIRPRPKSGHTPVSNGCGVKEFKVNLGEFTFLEKCCHAHDICYDTCNRLKDECDENLKKCLEGKCVEKEKRVEDCKNTAMMMLSGAELFGCDYYKESQKRACDCRPKEL